MIKLNKSAIKIKVNGTTRDIVRTFLEILLAKEKLTNKELDVTTELVIRYNQFLQDGVAAHYCSKLLFSTDIRKEMIEQLGISAAHFQNTLGTLQGKAVIAQDNNALVLNPILLPTEELTFTFKASD